MKQRDEIVKRQATRIRFHNKDMDFSFNWLLGTGSVVGLSHGGLFHVVEGMKDGDAAQWRDRFRAHGEFLEARSKAGKGASAAQDCLAAAFCFRASLQYSDPTAETFCKMVERMEAEFLEGAKRVCGELLILLENR